MKIKDLMITMPFSGIDWKLLAKQKKDLINLRSKLPPNSKNYVLLSGVIHLMDYLGDLHLDAINNIVLVQNYTDMKQYFMAETFDRLGDQDEFAYAMVISTRKTYKDNFIIAYPSTKFSPGDWANFKRYGINNPFELD